MKKIMVALLFVAVIASGASAQLMFGVSGAVHMDEQLSASDIKARFDSGEGVFGGGLIEIVGKHIGLGVTMNVSAYQGDVNVRYTYGGSTINVPTITDAALMDYDITGYISYHLFGGHAFLDPFGEFGGGVIATGFESDADQAIVPWDSPFLAASYYWYAGLGLGINLGPIGVFGKFSYNFPVKSTFKADFKETWDDGSPTGLSGETELGPYGYDALLADFIDGYLPKYRFTAGVKLIL
jgi:hypothetical protein